MEKSNIVFIGMMGSGKTIVSKELENRTLYSRVSTDEIIESQEKQTIQQIFKKHSEEYFRKKERDLIKKISQKKKLIIDCGGGIILNYKNVDDLKRGGFLIYLYSGLDFIYEMVKKRNNRPLLKKGSLNLKENVKKIMEEREKIYQQADYTLISEYRKKEDIVNEIMQTIKIII